MLFDQKHDEHSDRPEERSRRTQPMIQELDVLVALRLRAVPQSVCRSSSRPSDLGKVWLRETSRVIAIAKRACPIILWVAAFAAVLAATIALRVALLLPAF